MRYTRFCLFPMFLVLGVTWSRIGAIQLELSDATEKPVLAGRDIGPITCNCIGGCPDGVTTTWTHPQGYDNRLLFRDNGTLVVRNATINDDGVYNCTTVGTDDSNERNYTSYRVKIFGAFFDWENKNYWVVKPGETLGPISCNVSLCDHENCRYSWKKFKSGENPTILYNDTQVLEVEGFDRALDQAYYTCEVTNENETLTTNLTLFARAELYCYQCATSTGEPNTCKKWVNTLKKYRKLFQDERKLSDYTTNCSGHPALLYCKIETVQSKDDLFSYIRGCSDGKTFPYHLAKLKDFATPDNQTTCGYQTQGYQVCTRVCEGDFCNGPLKAGNIQASLLMTILLVIFTLILESSA